ncbi:MAG TPA: peptidoglycan DD-metalloendopeptidase family protein [Gammaproteobacteria bacterium]
MSGFRLLHHTVITVIFSSLVSVGLADSGFDQDKRLRLEGRKLQSIRSQIQKVQEELIRREEQRNSLLSELREAEQHLNKAGRKLHGLNRNTAEAKQALTRLQVERSQLQEQLMRNRQLLAMQLRSAFMSGSQEQVKLLLNQQDPAALSRVTQYYKYLNAARVATLQSTEKTLAGLEVVETGIADNTAALQVLKRQYEAEYRNWSQLRQERRELVTRIDRQIKEHTDTVEKLHADQARVQELIASLKGIFADIAGQPELVKQFTDLKGALNWPARGPLLNRYGQARAGSDLIWEGINIGAARGSEVRAVSHGRVAFADWLPGFGLMVIIDHGHGYMSLYGHNEALFKETGDWAETGEIIATVGDSGGKTQTALYFEVRHQGKPVNPGEWCRNTAG